MSGGIKFDQNKPRMGLLPWSALREVAKVLDHGAQKYSVFNWRKGMDWSRFYDAALRHLSSWIEGEDLDEESSLNHLAHAMCCLLFLLTYQLSGTGTDDRYKGEEEDFFS